VLDSGAQSSGRGGAALAVAVAVLSTAALLAGHLAGGGAVDVPWAPTWDLRLHFALDGLGALYGLLACGIGSFVFLYATAYAPLHLRHQDRPLADQRRLFFWLVVFMGAMVGLATAQDLILLFLFWDVTAVASWALVGFDRQEATARRAALMAMLVTGISAVLLLAGILVLRFEYGTTQLPELFVQAQAGTPLAVAGVLMAVGALAKSAQVPMHAWLPRAMAAPTPVSAYLHSAAMVAAGVFLLSRVHPLLAETGWLLDALLVVGFASMFVGGLIALVADELKQILAHSTIGQYGYVVVLLGIGGPYGAAGAAFYVLAHALSKCALFLTAGAVTEATGEKSLAALGGLGRRMPLLAAGSGAAAAGLAALPLTAGFFKDELFFKAALEHGGAVPVLCVLGAALTFAYSARFWGGIFLGVPRLVARAIPRRLDWPVAALGALVVLFGVVPGPLASLSEDAGAATILAAAPADVAYHLDTRAENLMALGAYGGGAAILLALPLLGPALRWYSALGRRIGPARLYDEGLRGLLALSDRTHDLEVRDLRGRVAAVLVPGVVLVVLGLLATPFEGAYRVGALRSADVPLLLALAVCAVAALTLVRPRSHTTIVLGLSGVGFALATAYALIGAPDVALVAVLVETVFALVFFGVYALVPRDVLQREARLPTPGRRARRDAVLGIASGVTAFAVVWGALSRPLPEGGMADRLLARTPDAHGYDAVTVILADFRGLDTLVEVTVVLVAAVAIVSLLREPQEGETA
jgi:multicomponent Na+:H+ antiporter subunit A